MERILKQSPTCLKPSESKNRLIKNKQDRKKDASKSNKEKSQEESKMNMPKKEYSFEAQQKKQILNQLLRKEAATKRRIEEKRSHSSKKSKDW